MSDKIDRPSEVSFIRGMAENAAPGARESAMAYAAIVAGYMYGKKQGKKKKK
jgi:hypothetical protein